jgi:hypothetical protein
MKNELINTLPQLKGLMTNTYIFAIIAAVVAVLLAMLVANLIPYKGGEVDRSYIRRRIWFLLIWFFSIAGFFLYNNFVIIGKIGNVAFQSKFMICIAISCLIILMVYGIMSFILMKIFPRTKFGSILG